MNEGEHNLVRSLRGQFFSHIPSVIPSLPETLYHYTSAAGLHGIIKSGLLRGSNYAYLNDSSEIAYGRKVARGVIRERIRTEDNEHGRVFLEAAQETLDDNADLDVYLTCFCKTADLLSQWRGYTSASSGFCIGFDTLGFNETKSAQDFSGSIVYEKKRQREKVQVAIDKAHDFLMKGRPDDEAFRAALEEVLIDKLLSDLCLFKDPGFKEEDEWRMVHIARDTSAVNFCTDGGTLKPYVDMIQSTSEPPRLPITELFATDALAERSANLLLKRFGYKNVIAERSSIPFREI